MTEAIVEEEMTRLEKLVEKSNAVRETGSDVLRTVRSRIDRAFGANYVNMPPELDELAEESIPDIQVIGDNMEVVTNKLKLIYGWIEGLYQDSEETIGSEKESDKRNLMAELREQSRQLATLSYSTKELIQKFIEGVIGDGDYGQKEEDEEKTSSDDVSIMDNEFDKVCLCLDRIRCLAERL